MMMHQGWIKIILLTFVTCGIYGWIYLYKTGEEMRERGADMPPFWHFFIPILNLLWLLKWTKSVEHVTGGKVSSTTILIAWILFFPAAIYFVQAGLNELR